MAPPKNCTLFAAIIALLQSSWQLPNLEYQRTHNAPDFALLSVHLGELAGKARDFVPCRNLQNRRGDDVNRRDLTRLSQCGTTNSAASAKSEET